MEEKVEIAVSIIIILFAIMGFCGLVTYAFIHHDEIEQRIEEKYRLQQEIENRKGACVEYEGGISGNLILNGSHGEIKCVKWEDTQNPGQYIR